MAGAAYRRTLLKVSGEALMGDAPYGIDAATVARIARQIQDAQQEGTEIAVVVGGGNIFRGINASAGGMDRGWREAVAITVSAFSPRAWAMSATSLSLENPATTISRSYSRYLGSDFKRLCTEYTLWAPSATKSGERDNTSIRQGQLTRSKPTSIAWAGTSIPWPPRASRAATANAAFSSW